MSGESGTWAHPGDEVLSKALARKERRVAAGKSPHYRVWGYVCLDCRHPSSGHSLNEPEDGWECEVCGCVLPRTPDFANREVGLMRGEWRLWKEAITAARPKTAEDVRA